MSDVTWLYNDGDDADADEEIDLEALIELLSPDLPALTQAYFTTYRHLVDAGFSAEQALALVIARGWYLGSEEA